MAHLDIWKNEGYDITLQPNVKSYHARPYPIPKVHETTLTMEIERLCKIGVLRKINQLEQGSPTLSFQRRMELSSLYTTSEN
jgi:hypothetical protein